MFGRGRRKRVAAQIIAALAGGAIGAAAGGTAVAIPVAAAVAVVGKVVDVLASRKSRPEQSEQFLTQWKAERAFEGVTSLRAMLLKASGVLPGEYKEEIDRLASDLDDVDRAKENRLLLEALSRLFRETGGPPANAQAFFERFVQKKVTVSAADGSAALVIDASGANAPVTVQTIQAVAPAEAGGDETPSETRQPDPFWPGPSIRSGSQTVVDPFCGRTVELKQLRDAVRRSKPLICVVGMAGQGKSALLGQWHKTSRRARKDRALFWCRPYESGYTFVRFLADILPYLTEGRYPFQERPGIRDQAEDLCQLLRRQPTLVVLDGVERWLRRWVADPDATGENVTPDARAGAEDGLDMFLRDAAAWTNGSGLILTTRALPSALDDRPLVRIGTGQEHGEALAGLSDAAAVELLGKLGVEGDSDQVLRAANEYDNHALTLTILGRLLQKEHGGDVRKRPEIDPARDDPQERLGKLLRKVEAHHAENLPVLLLACSCLSAAPLNMLAALLKEDEKRVRHRLGSLGDWHLVRFDGKSVEVHALIRRYFLGGSSTDDTSKAQVAIAQWFAGQPIPEEPVRLTQVQPRVSAIEHALAAGQAELADSLLCTRAGKHYATLTPPSEVDALYNLH